MGYRRRLRKMVEKPYITRWWGMLHIVEAKLLPQKFGDGRFLVYLCPINSRPNYYVAQVDSQWKDGDLNSDEFRELIEEIEMTIEDYFGHVDMEDDDGNRFGDSDELSAWPTASLTDGVKWGKYTRNPRRIYHKYKAKSRAMTITRAEYERRAKGK